MKISTAAFRQVFDRISRYCGLAKRHIKLTLPVEIEGGYFMQIGYNTKYRKKMQQVCSEETVLEKEKECVLVNHCGVCYQSNCLKS